MDKLLYNYFGYNEDSFKNKNARLIQKTYRHYRMYNIEKKCDMMKYGKYLVYMNDKKLDNETKDELEYWKNKRHFIKNDNKIKVILKDYEIINNK
jgi:hypothetical protein